MPGDLDTGQGIEAAVDGTGIIVHCAGSSKGDEDKARTLVRAASRAGVRHLVNISVVGADRVPMASGLDRAMFGYFGSKLAAEQVIAGSGVPWTTLRATQFHELVLMVARQMTRLPVIPVPSGLRFQPVDAGEVAARLAELALGGPAGLVPDLAGPRVYRMADLLRSYQQATGKHRALVSVRLPGQAARAFRAGANPGSRPGRRSPDLGRLPGRPDGRGRGEQIPGAQRPSRELTTAGGRGRPAAAPRAGFVGQRACSAWNQPERRGARLGAHAHQLSMPS